MLRKEKIAEVAARVIAGGLEVSDAAEELLADAPGTVTLGRAQQLIGAEVRRQEFRARVEEDSLRTEWFRELAQSVVDGTRTIGDVAAELETDPDTATAVLAVVDPRMSTEKEDLTASTLANFYDAVVDSHKLGVADRERGGTDPKVLAERQGIVATLAAQAAIAVNNLPGSATTQKSEIEAAPNQGGGPAADGGQAGRPVDQPSTGGREATRKRR